MKMSILVMVIILSVANIASADIFGTGDNQFTIDFVNISGDASSANGTAMDPYRGFSDPTNDYRIGTYEITNDQWDKFTNIQGTPTGSPSVAYDRSTFWTGTNIPTTQVSWYEAAQFVNWLNTSTGHHAAYKFTGTLGTSDYSAGVWEAGDAGYDSSNPFRNSNAYYILPTEDEWVKAAYWNGTSLQEYATKPGETLYQGNGSNGGWNYTVGLDYGPDGPYEGPWDVGSGSEELNGTFDMMGNVREWFESPFFSGESFPSASHGFRGGTYRWRSSLEFSYRDQDYEPSYEDNGGGFRVASVPEPTTVLLIGLGGLMFRRKR